MVQHARRFVAPVVGAALVAGALALAAPPAEAATTTVTVTASADTYADAANPTRNYGSASYLLSRGTPGGVAWLRFALPAYPAGTTLTGVALRLRTTTDPAAGSAATHTVRVASGSWTESGLTWNNQPANTGTALGTVSGATAASTTYSTALATAPLAGLSGTTLNITVASTGTDGLYVQARSGGSTSARPALVLTFTSTTTTDSTPPSSPANVVASVAGGSVGLTWTASTDDTGVTAYDVHRSASQGFAADSTNLVGSTAATSFTDPGRPAGTWFYRVVARDAAGNRSTASTAVAAVVPDTTAPTAPTGLTAVAGSEGGTLLSWTASTDDVGVTAYDVHRSAVSGFAPDASTLLGSTAATAFTDATAPAGTVYYVAVARDLAGNQSPPSTQAQGPTAAGDTTPPSEPLGLAVSAPGTSPVLSWLAATDDTGVTGYELHRAADPSFTPSAATLVGSTTALSLGDPSVPGGTWSYRVVARDAAGNRSVSGPLAVSITAGTGATTTIEPIADTYGNAGAPTSNFGGSSSLNSRGSIGATSWLRFVLPAKGSAPLATATLRFRTNTDTTAGSLDAHTVAVANDSWSETTLTWNNQPALGGPVLGTITGATAVGTAYTTGLDAAAIDARLGTQMSISISSTGTDSLWFWSRNHPTASFRPVLVLTWPANVVAPAPPPGPPTDLAATPGAGAVHLAWTAPATSLGVASYDLERSSDPAFPAVSTLRITSITATSYDDRNLAVGGYWYRVTAVDGAGARGAASTAVPVSVTESAPSDVTVYAVGDLVCTPGTTTTASTCRHADVATAVAASGADWFMPLGDIQYQYGLFTDFVAPGGYDASFGQFLPRTIPVVGNHEYADSTGAGNGYFQYFDPNGTGQFGAKPAGYYTRTLGTWRLIVINSECSVGIENAQHMLAGGCAPGSPEYTWLEQVLQASTEKCTIAAFHRPRWSSMTASTNPSSYPDVAPLWDLLAQYGVEMALSGHKHGSEVFPPIGVSGTGNPVADPNGVVQFVAGGGGKDLGPFDPLTTAAGQLVLARDNTTFGGLVLKLHDGSWDWAFTPVAGMAFKNQGTSGAFSGTGVSCH